MSHVVMGLSAAFTWMSLESYIVFYGPTASYMSLPFQLDFKWALKVSRVAISRNGSVGWRFSVNSTLQLHAAPQIILSNLPLPRRSILRSGEIGSIPNC
ncbi:hypothetical protein MLD38_005357 [Melastoma candidum]|uniref:Uncharacterized protein n=1 Tax=Melastoma candidum TaxID=119954 RepID=A0ACB9SBV4_9MYRT|nr:hypothetical protein MLD38_005357 [Melastoma candidum]